MKNTEGNAIKNNIFYLNSLDYIKILYFIFEFGIYLTTLIRVQLTISEISCAAIAVALGLARILISCRKLDVMSFYLWVYVDASLILWVQIKNIVDGFSPPGSTSIMAIGIASLLFLLIVSLFRKRLNTRSISRMIPLQTRDKWKSYTLILIIVAGCYLSTWLSDYMGIAALGRERKNYTFHIAGLIENLRLYINPILLLVIVDRFRESGVLTKYFSIFVIISWFIYDGAVKMSKGSLIYFAVLYGVYLAYNNKIKLYHLIFAAILLAASLYSYNTIQFYRYYSPDGFSLKGFIACQETAKEIENSLEDGKFIKAYTRFFLAGYHLSVLHTYFTDNNISIFEATKVFPKDVSPPELMTHYVKQFPLNAYHSEGSTFLTEGLFYLGPAGVVCGVVFFSLLCQILDSSPFLMKRTALQAGIAYNIHLFLNVGIYEVIFFRYQVGIGILMGLIGIAIMYGFPPRLQSGFRKFVKGYYNI